MEIGDWIRVGEVVVWMCMGGGWCWWRWGGGGGVREGEFGKAPLRL